MPLWLARRHAGYRTIKRLSETTGINKRRLGHILTFGETPSKAEMEQISAAIDDGLRLRVETDGTFADILRKALEPLVEH